MKEDAAQGPLIVPTLSLNTERTFFFESKISFKKSRRAAASSSVPVRSPAGAQVQFALNVIWAQSQ